MEFRRATLHDNIDLISAVERIETFQESEHSLRTAVVTRWDIATIDQYPPLRDWTMSRVQQGFQLTFRQ